MGVLYFNFLQLHQGNQILTKEKKMEEKRKIQQSSNDFEMSSLFVPMSRMNNCQLDGYGPPEKNPEKNPRYKTEICRNFKERSNCIYGKKCQFAHGRQELCDVNIEYELVQDQLELQDVVITIQIPHGSGTPVVAECDGGYTYEKKGTLLWQLPMIDAKNKTGSIEF